MRSTPSLKLGLAGLVLVGSAISAGGVAFADYGPQAGDVVGVGGDTAQYATSFLADGDTAGDAGFNAAGSYNRLATFNATADANGRSGYLNGSTLAAPLNLNPTVVLRAGTFPVQRVSSSGAALTAFLADTSQNINFIWSSSQPTAAQQSTAATKGWGFLHVVQIGTDAVKIATASTTDAPAGLSVGQLLFIYTHAFNPGTSNPLTWNNVPGNSGGSTNAVVPEIPPSSSSIYKTLIADLKAANGNVAPTLGSNVKTVEQNDPTAITSSSAPADTIVPFSQARLNLWTSGYFHNPATAYPGGSALISGIKLLSGTPGDSNAVYASPITDYVIFRQSDANLSTPFEPGGALNWVQTLFSNPSGSTNPFVDTAAGQALITASGVTASYNDLGNVSQG